MIFTDEQLRRMTPSECREAAVADFFRAATELLMAVAPLVEEAAKGRDGKRGRA